MPNDKRIKRDKNGLYYVRYEAGFKPDGSRNQKYRGGFETADDAEAFLNEEEYSLRHGTYINPEKTLVCQYLNKWLEDRKDELSPTTYSGYEVNIRCHINPHIGGLRLQDLKAVHIKEMYKALQKDRNLKIDNEMRSFKRLSPKSILYVRRVLTKALEDACTDEILEKNAAKAAKSPEVSKYKAKFLSAAEIRTMLEKFEEDELFIPVFLSVVLGLRRGEALGLQWNNVDFENKVVMIRQEYTMADGKPILLNDVKTEGSDRDIIVTDKIISILKAYQTKQKALRLQNGNKYKNNFVCTWADGSLMNPSHISRSFKLRMKAYGLPEMRFHDLRHSNGALMIGQNLPLKGTSDRLGHSTIVITNDLYGHVEKSVQEQIAQSIDKAIWNE